MTYIAKEPLLTKAKAIASDNDAFGIPRIIKLIEDAPTTDFFEELEALFRRQDMPITITSIMETKAYKELKKKYKESNR